MSDDNLITRYQQFRTRRFLKNHERTRNMLPSWRTRGRRRLLTGVVAVSIALFALCGVLVVAADRMWALPLLPITAVFFAAWTALQIVSSRQGDAPRDALDEWEIARRNSARSVGLTVTQVVGMIPTAILIYASSTADVDRDLAYACGVWFVAALLAGGCLPAMLLAWSEPDSEPED
ncbi:hypothetical protein [Rhodococcus sp. HNM0569]|uniref:hypothetical protein n=1 Tax=Rhodococcus sp. HNM0569 TaxID=2716340 RepID=UPI001469C0F4|nr:hypothetical protein [Rhodococcus sp. HNM0569]NLU82462.1 hypothetical protein [Rhodococcus sp. HNM0569]